MALDDLQQVQKLFEESKYVLVVYNGKSNGDATASAIALKILLEKLKKQVDIVAAGYSVPKKFHFLPQTDTIKSDISQVQKFIIKLDVSQSPIETISYDVRDNQLSLYLTPKHGIISKNELRTAQSSFKYDLIITLHVSDLVSLGAAFNDNADLFYKTSILNIDHEPNNERFGQVNLIDLTSTSVSETVYKTIKKIHSGLIDAEMATALLAGMTVATKSFRNYNITPVTLQLASELITYGADREKIMENLYRTRSIAALKLWGQALSHLEHDAKHSIVWTALTRDDFTRSGSTEEDLQGIIDELIGNSPEAKTIVLIFEAADKKITALVATEKSGDALELTKKFSPQGNKKTASIQFDGLTLKEVEIKLLDELRRQLA
ncbi:MAG: hypothetical protein A3I29_03730 [Candidatus Magasanikbacteria bacterium RIFCSPLOWO2_02_FULL_44_11]|uniref:DDH domain-containing protein n=2 Tax=Candidatus Magasanikiibacteriota TaxID=1752731 RepID=A0A1F6NAM6_9BACT|nr:MAG: hypothetical protein A3D53_00050 [Candidatus Magasanikbacteria bacterium RIFCSPHIGHO2_02_FULL_45_10]OGH80975.1 MAG: hypothetical protein A3I29_03730 [Candidatus Magasanikbacteria bacterium RIFCSPLOWO2_02_FULL_44_11]